MNSARYENSIFGQEERICSSSDM